MSFSFLVKVGLSLPAPVVSTAAPSGDIIPDNAFIFDQDSYWVFDGKLKMDAESEFRSNKYLGYFFVGLGIILLLFAILNSPFSWGGLYSLVGFIFFAGLGLFMIKFHGGHEYFNQRGKVVVGELVSIKGQNVEVERNGVETTYYRITAQYSFYGPGHQTQIVGTTTCKRDGLANQPLPASGTPVVVLYINPQKFLAC